MNAANKPAFTWADVTQQPEFQNATQEEREAMQLRFFQQVVAPAIPREQYREARSQFFESTLEDTVVRQPGLLRRSMDAAGNLAGAVSDRLRPEEPVFDTLAWQEVERSEAFQQGDTRQRHDLRQQFFRDNVAGDLEGEERREAERAFYAATDIRGTVEGSDWRPDRQGERRGLDTWESGATGRRPTESMEDARERAVEIGAPREDGSLRMSDELLRGLQNAGRGVMESYYGTQAMLADDEGERQRLLARAAELRGQSEQNQATMPNFTEIRSPGDAARWAVHGIGAMAPSVGSIMAGGAAGGKAGGLVGAAAGPKGAALGAIVGSTIGSFSAGYGLYAGGLYSDIRQQGGEHEPARKAALKWGAPASAVSIVMPMAFLGSVTGYLGKDFVRNRATNMMLGAGLGMVGEGTAEALAETFTIMGEEEVLGRTLTDEERRARIINAGTAGGLMGFSMGTVGGGVQRQGDLDTLIDGFIADMEKAYTEGASEDVRQAVIATLESADSLTENQQAMLDYLRTERADRNRPLNQELKEIQQTALDVHQRDDATNLARFTELAGKQANGRLTGSEALEMIALQVNSPAVHDALAQEAQAQLQIEGDPMAQQQATQDIAAWEQAWRDHEQQHGLGPIDLGQPTGVSATVSPGTPATGGQESGGLLGSAMGQATAGDAQTADLLRAEPADSAPEIARAQESLAMGDGFAFLWERTSGDLSAQDSLTRMQQAYLQGDREGAAAAYQEAMTEIRAIERAEQQGARRQEAIDQARAEAAAQGGDALDQAMAGEQAEAEANAISEQENAADPITPPAPTRAPATPATDLLGDSIPERPAALTPSRVPVDRIQVDPEAYQFRTEVNQAGVDARLDGVQEWDDLRAGNLLLHERADGSLYAADGHHRVDLARRLSQPDVNAIVLREADGYSIEDARRLAAEANIAAGNATAIDAAKVFRDSEGTSDDVIAERNLPRRSQVVRDGADIARLGDEAFGAVLNGVVSEKDGAAIGRAFESPDQQLAAIEVFQQVQPQNDNQRTLLANEIRQAGFSDAQADQLSMFGDDPAQSLIGERVKVMDRLRQMLVGDRRLFATLNNNAQTAEQAGNRIATEQNEALMDASGRAIALLERVATTPEINQQINDAARRVSEGQPVAEAARELKEALLRGTRSEAAQPDRASAPGSRPAETAGQEQRGDQRVPAQDDARAADAGQQRLDGAAPDVNLRANGQPFATERSVRAAKRFRDTPGAVPVEVDGGWGWMVQGGLTGRSEVTQAQADAAQDVEIGVNNQGDTVLENPVTGIRTFRTRQGGGNSELGRPNRHGVYVMTEVDVRNRRAQYDVVENNWRETGQQAFTAAQPTQADFQALARAQQLSAEQRSALRDYNESSGAAAFNMTPEQSRIITEAARANPAQERATLYRVDREDASLVDRAGTDVRTLVPMTTSRRWANSWGGHFGDMQIQQVTIEPGTPMVVVSEGNTAEQEVLVLGTDVQVVETSRRRLTDAEREAMFPGEANEVTIAEYTVSPRADVDAADTSAQRVEETAIDRQVETDPDDTLTLETQTEEGLAAREQETQAAEQAEAESRRQEAQRAQADRDADDFLLTGSDSAADQAMARGQDSLFRLEPPADVAARRDAIAESIGQHPELAGVQPVARVAELPATVQITMLTQGIDPRSVRGVFVGGELYVVAENVADTAEGVKVAVHEAVGHRGVREVLGDRLAPEMQRLYATFPQTHEVFRQVRERYPHLDTTTREGRQEFAEELIAHLAETNPQVNAWQRFVARVRDLLRQAFPEVAWTENDVRALIQRSRETLAEQALADDATLFSLSGDGRVRMNRPVHLDDGSRLSGYTNANRDTFYGYDQNGEPFTVRADQVSADAITRSEDGNRTADAVRRQLTGTGDVRFSIARALDHAKGKAQQARIASEEQFFTDFWPKALRATGLRRQPTPRNVRRGVRQAITDMEAWLRDNPRFMDYYSADMAATREVLDNTFGPVSDEQFQLFQAYLGLTSPSTPLKANIGDAMNAMRLFLDEGSLARVEMGLSPKGNPVVASSPFTFASTTGATKARALKVLDTVIEQQGGIQQAMDYLQEGVTTRELHQFNRAMGYKGAVGDIGAIRSLVMEATGQDQQIPRMFIFGKKVGAYTLNTMGDSRYTTIDIWESRFIRSYFDGMFEQGTGLPVNRAEHDFFSAFNSAFKDEMQARFGQEFEASALQAMRWFYILNSAREAGYANARTESTISEYAQQVAAERFGANDQGGRGRGAQEDAGAGPAAQELADGTYRTTPEGGVRFSVAPPTDSQAFREWFGDSKAVDENGEPLVVHHGIYSDIAAEDLSVFELGHQGYDPDPSNAFYFTTSAEVAREYTGGDPDNTLSVYLKAENPLDLRIPEHQEIVNSWLEDIETPEGTIQIPFGSNDTVWEDVVAVYTEPNLLMNQIVDEAKEAGFDSLVMSDGNREGAADSWVVFEPDQIKSATDNQGTFDPSNPDIRFSLSEAPQQPRLSAIHNISADGLAYADQMGGLAVPSIGVITEQAGGVEGFGEITLIGRRGLADPAQEAVFSADAYTVRFPRPEFEGYSEADYRRLREQLEPYAERFDSQTILATLREHGKDAPDARELVNRALNSSPVMAMYLESQGQEAQPVMRAADPGQYGALLEHPAMAEWLDANVLADAYVASMDGDHGPMQRFTQALREAYIDTNVALVPESMRERQRPLIEMRFDSSWVGGHDSIQDSRFNEIAREVESFGQRARQEVDPLATRDALQEQVTDEAGFKRWIEETFVAPMGEPRIKVGRRKLPYTLENIVEAMTRERAIAGREETMTFGAGQARAANAEQFQTLERMREAAADQIRSPAEYEAAKAETEALLEDFRERVAGHTTIENYRGQPDTWEGLDGAMRAVARYLGYQRRGRAAFERALKAEKFDVAAIKSQEGVAERQAAAERRVNERREDVQRLQEQLDALDANDPRREPASYRLQQAEKSLARLETEAGRIGGDIIALGMQAAEALEQAPVPYFEAKPQRAVALGEFAGAVIPEGAPQSVREILDRNGLPYREAPSDQRAQAVHDFRAELDQGGEDVLFSLGDQAERPTATQVRDSLQGVEGLGRPAVLDTYNQLDLDTGLRLTLRGLDPQTVVAFHDDAGRLRVIAGNAESAQDAVQAAVLERVKRNGLGAVLGDRLDTIGKNAYGQLPGNTAAREILRVVRAEYDYLNPSTPGDRTVLTLEVLNRLQERGNAPSFATEAMEQVRALLGERYGISDAGNLARANRAYLDRMQRDYGRKRPPAPPAFQLDMQDSGGTGTLLDLGPQVIDGDGNVISDARVASFWTFNPFQQLGNFFFSQSDRLRATGSRPLVELGNRIDRYFDQSDRRLGVVNAILREPLKAMQQGMPKARKERQRQFEQYWRDWDNGRREAAQAIYDANPTVAAMVDAAVEMFHQTGLENQSVKTPTRTGMWVFDGKGYRKIGKIRKGEFWPRALRREVQAVLQDPSADPALWRELVDALVDGGHAKDRQEAGTMLMDRNRGYFSEQVTRDYFAGIEKARGEKLPEIFYDYSLDVVADYASKWAMRISQAEQFGQKLRPTDKDAFDEAMGMAADKRSEKFIGQVRDNIYGAQNIGMYGEFMGNANVLATGLHLGNWATASQNLTTGSALNVQMFGARRVAKAYAELVRDWDTIYREGVAEGILGKDVMNLIRDTDSHQDANVFSPDSQTGRFHKLMERFNAGNMSGREMIREFSRLAMKYGGYNATEQMIRANAFVAAKAQLADALHAWNQKPNSLDAKKYRRFMSRNRLDVDALIAENGKGEETSKYLRLMVNLPQGSYRGDQAPLYVDTQIGRFFFKYQKFGTQTSRLFWQQRLKPFVDLVQDSNATAAERAGAFLDILHYVGTGVAAGFLNRKTRSILFGMAFVGADWDEILDRFNDEDWGLTLAWLTDMAFHSAMSAGSIFGFFGSPMQAVIDFRDGQRVKNPMEPPGFAVFQGIQSLGVKFWQQGGYLSVPDVRDAVLREVSLPRVADRTAQSALNAIGADLDRTKLEMNRRDVGYIRGAARRWADVEGIEARASGSFSPGSTENTPANNRIHDAVRIGDGERARQLVMAELEGLDRAERASRLRSIRATLRARHPLRLAGNTMNQEQQAEFKRWARESLPPSKWETIDETTKTYDQTMARALWRL